MTGIAIFPSSKTWWNILPYQHHGQLRKIWRTTLAITNKATMVAHMTSINHQCCKILVQFHFVSMVFFSFMIHKETMIFFKTIGILWYWLILALNYMLSSMIYKVMTWIATFDFPNKCWNKVWAWTTMWAFNGEQVVQELFRQSDKKEREDYC
jgi:hypothetical protein